MPRKKPTTPEEVKTDIESHPGRGQLDGEDVVRFELLNLQLSLPRELENQLLEIGACLGMSKSEVFRHAIASFVALPGNQAMIERWQQKKAEKFGVSKSEIRSKAFGCFKKAAREKRSRLQKDSLEGQNND
jgi:predicted transcriptional regulator